MVQAKRKPIGLLVHVWIHVATMLVLFFGLLKLPLQPVIWTVPAVGLFHYAIDLLKNLHSRRHPQSLRAGYILDQGYHLIVILLCSLLLPLLSGWNERIPHLASIRTGSGLILVTHVWYISERILFQGNELYQRWAAVPFWPRMMSRAALLSGALLGWTVWGAISVLLACSLHWFDLHPRYRWHALGIDSAVVTTVFLFLTLTP